MRDNLRIRMTKKEKSVQERIPARGKLAQCVWGVRRWQLGGRQLFAHSSTRALLRP